MINKELQGICDCNRGRRTSDPHPGHHLISYTSDESGQNIATRSRVISRSLGLVQRCLQTSCSTGGRAADRRGSVGGIGRRRGRSPTAFALPPSNAYNKNTVRHSWAILLLAVFSFSLISPVVFAGADAK